MFPMLVTSAFVTLFVGRKSTTSQKFFRSGSSSSTLGRKWSSRGCSRSGEDGRACLLTRMMLVAQSALHLLAIPYFSRIFTNFSAIERLSRGHICCLGHGGRSAFNYMCCLTYLWRPRSYGCSLQMGLYFRMRSIMRVLTLCLRWSRLNFVMSSSSVSVGALFWMSNSGGIWKSSVIAAEFIAALVAAACVFVACWRVVPNQRLQCVVGGHPQIH